MYLEIITTPNDDLKETGFGSLKSCNNVLKSLQELGYTARLNVCENIEDLNEIVSRKPDLVILAVKYITIQDHTKVWLSEFFAANHINFTGSSRETLKFDSNKVDAKVYLQNKGIKTAKYFTALPDQYKDESELPLKFPLFLKPLDAANGNGIDDQSYVTTFDEFQEKVTSLYALFNLPVLVEEFLEGNEYTVAVCKKENGELLVAPIEIIPPESKNGLRILGELAKKSDTEELRKTIPGTVTKGVKELAINVFNKLGIRDFGRIDIKTDKEENCYFMEANLVPGMTYGTSYFPLALEIELDLNYNKVVELIIAGGISRIPVVSTIPA